MSVRKRKASLAVRRRRSSGGRSSTAFRKLAPRHVAKNPVMFVVEIGQRPDHADPGSRPRSPRQRRRRRSGSRRRSRVWLWFTVLFANFAEAVAEGRGKAQADTLRKMRKETTARRLRGAIDGRKEEVVAVVVAAQGRPVVVEAGQLIPGDGEVIEGIASVDESAITGESAPVIRESGGDRSAVTGGTKVLSDRIVVRITVDPGESFLDRMIAPRRGRGAAEDARTRSRSTSCWSG